jgi:predicted glycoside hydrolase/deacetylase ChbG (UPF0249 family)
MKKIILCADDFGQSAAISGGILQLARARRLSAVSCLTESECWPECAVDLIHYRETIDIGLHFNLTHGFKSTRHSSVQSFTPRPLPALLIAALSGRIDRRALAIGLHEQLDRFENSVGAMPDFVDGHQHVHIFPGIRATLLRELGRRYPHRKPYLRAVNPRLRSSDGALKLSFLKLLNSGFNTAARQHRLQTTAGFGGIYSLRTDANFPMLMKFWLNAARHGDLLMCHPGLADNDATDPIAATRPNELQFLNSPEFAALLPASGVQLSRFEML